MDEKEYLNVDTGKEWRTRLTTADGSSIELDPSLLDPNPSPRRARNEDDENDGTYDPLDDLGRTPPRTSMMKNRKWSHDRKYAKEMEKRIQGPKSPSARQLRTKSLQFALRGGNSPKASKARRNQQSLKTQTNLRDFIQDDPNQFEYSLEDSDGSKSRYLEDERGEDLPDLGRSRANTMSLGPEHGDSLRTGNTLRQADSLPMGYRVKSTARFMALNSFPVPVSTVTSSQHHSITSSGTHTPRKRSSVCESQDRIAFYSILSALFKSQTKKEKQRYEHAESYDRQPSKEETIYQNEVKELIWLDLQAWFAGRSIDNQDKWLISERKSADSLSIQISTYRFSPHQDSTEKDLDNENLEEVIRVSYEPQTSTDSGLSTAEIFYDAQETITSKAKLSPPCIDPSLESALAKLGLSNHTRLQPSSSISQVKREPTPQPIEGEGEESEEKPVTIYLNTIGEDSIDGITMSFPQTPIHQDCVCDSLIITCSERIKNTNNALYEVENILQQLESIEALFPSSSQLVRAYPAFGDDTFKTRVRVLCMWFNLTDQLNKKIEILGQILRGFGGRHKHLIPWPQLDPTVTQDSDEGIGTINSDVEQKSEEKSAGSAETSRNSSGTQLQNTSPHKVHFRLTADALTSSPSDSNNSSSSESTAVVTSSGAVSAKIQGDGLAVRKPVRQESAVSQLSASFLSDSYTDTGDGELCTNPYRRYVEKMLKTKGIRKTLASLHKITRVTLSRAKIALERPVSADDIPLVGPNVYHPHLEERFSSGGGGKPDYNEDEIELSKYGCWNPEFARMNLPSFRAAYLFLARVPRDLIHECLIIRLEQKPVEPSELSIRQLMRECKEALKLAVTERQRYILRVKAAIVDVEKDKEFLESFDREMQEYDDHLTDTLDVYLEYLRNFVTMIQGDVSLLLSTYQKNLLEQEWDFIKCTCPHIPGGESRAGNTFCQMARGMLSAIEDFLQTGNDEIMKNMYVLADSYTEEDEDTEIEYQTRKRLLEAFRGFQSLFAEARDRSIKAIAFAKLLRKDLEVAAEYKMTVDSRKLLPVLHLTGHVQVKAPHSKQHLIFIPGSIKHKEEHIIKLLDMHCGQTSINDMNQGYLVLTEHKPEEAVLWEGETIFVKPTAETTISLSQIEVHGVLLVAPTAVQLESRRKEFSRCMRDVLVCVQDQRATSQAIASSLEDVKQGALSLREKISEELISVEEKCDTSSLEGLEPVDRDTLVRRMREILQQCYKFGFEYHKELDRLITGEEGRKHLARGTIQFSKQWMKFVLNWCDSGKGLRPDWAYKGVEFSIHAANPQNTKYLDDCEFQDFKNLITECHNHVAPDPDRKSRDGPDLPSRPYSRSGSRTSSRTGSRTGSPHRAISVDSRADLDRTIMPPPTTPLSPGSPTHLPGGSTSPLSPSHQLPGGGVIPTSPYNTLGRRKRSEGHRRSVHLDDMDAADISVKVPVFANLPWRERVKRSIENFEQERDETRVHQQTIGRVLDKTLHEDRIHIKARLVKFSWQRGVKIGQGHFGKVYTAINNETGDIMAMKEIPLQPNDHKTLKNVADELRIFESIHHPHLINHFGVEVHREEMLIFMEYCPEGTLEAFVTSTESGLEESLVRRYTRQLLEAVACLHEHGIVHRDIKGANIFLTDEMRNLKLGDFGCAVKIKAHTTMPGELQGFVGTQAYMAPEVFTRNMTEGHGRSADIWSLGCVVIEMATGRRPWAQLESNYQIMFKVGMGETPEIPETLSEEGKEFLQQVFVHDPTERASAEDLLNHQFTKIYEDEEGVQSIPLFSSVNPGSTSPHKPLVRKDSNKY